MDTNTLPDTMTAQEIFSYVKKNLLQQGCKSGYPIGDTEEFFCQYRDRHGNKCAAGHLIRDDEYEFWMEGTVMYTFLTDTAAVLFREKCPQSLKVRIGSHGPLVQKLQTAHDDYEPHQWPERFAIIAEEFGLLNE